MALDKVIDSAALEANLTSVADAIRTKGGTTGSLAFPDGFVTAVEGIEKGINVQTYTGTVTTNTNGFASFTCGFKPDLVYVNGTYTYESDGGQYEYILCFPFAASVMESSGYTATCYGYSNTYQYGIDADFARTDTGFTVTIGRYNSSYSWVALSGYSLRCTAVKYTA